MSAGGKSITVRPGRARVCSIMTRGGEEYIFFYHPCRQFVNGFLPARRREVLVVVVVFDVYTRAPSGLLHDFDVSTGGGKVLRSTGKWIGGSSSGKRFETRGVHTHQPAYIYIYVVSHRD